MRVGVGYDVHALTVGRRLILGGVDIPHEKGLEGYSDADVLVHALCDALLGAAGLGDIGQQFPDSRPEFKNIYSIHLLSRTCDMIRVYGLEPVNIDATIIAQEPRLAPFIPAMQRKIARAIDCDPTRINIKATTTEGLGTIGKGQGMAAMCVVLLKMVGG